MTESKKKKTKEIEKVIVTYHDKHGWWIFKRYTKRTFDSLQWLIFGERIRKVARSVKIIHK